jgi:monoamine oxidase
VLDWDLHDWTGDPYTRGAYSYALVGGALAGKRLMRPVEDTLFFAGEAIGEGDSGTVPAAIASGRRAARQILG